MESPDPLVWLLNLADLLALMTGIGLLSCRLWVFSGAGRAAEAVLVRRHLPFWRLLGLCLAVLTATSLGLLIQRSLAMSGLPLTAVGTILPTVWTRTHFGHVWLLRPAALTLLWLGWGMSGRLQSSAAAVLMLGAAIALVVSRSLSGHAADWGDGAWPEWADGLHLLAAATWGGALLALALGRFRVLTDEHQARMVAVIGVHRLSSLCGAALAVVVSSGICSAWLELGSPSALWETAYGRTLLAKLVLVLGIVGLGAANRYVGLPYLRDRAVDLAGSPPPLNRLPRPLAALTGWLHRGRQAPLERFTRLMAVETVLMAGLIICVAVLANLTPARHLRHAGGTVHDHRRGMLAPNPGTLRHDASQLRRTSRGIRTDASALCSSSKAIPRCNQCPHFSASRLSNQKVIGPSPDSVDGIIESSQKWIPSISLGSALW